MKNNFDIIIIGAGIAGLSTGYYGQMNDYKTQHSPGMENAAGGFTKRAHAATTH